MIYTIVQGADATMDIGIKDTSGNPIVISTLENVTVFLYQRRENILGEYSLVDNTVDIKDDVNGIVSIYVQRDSLTDVPVGDLYVEIWVDVPNANFYGGFKRNKFSDVKIAKLINTVK